MTDEIGNTLIHLVKTYSPTGKERNAVSVFNNYLKKCGATEVVTDDAGNGIGTFPGEGLSVVLCGHIDTVPGKLPVRVKDGILYGRGAVDAKSSLISLLYGAMIAKESGFKGTLKVVAAIGEEGPGKGILEFVKTQPRSDYAIFGEPGNVSGITVGYKGRLLIDVSFWTESFHASAPWMGGSAVEAAIMAWSRIRSLQLHPKCQRREDWKRQVWMNRRRSSCQPQEYHLLIQGFASPAGSPTLYILASRFLAGYNRCEDT